MTNLISISCRISILTMLFSSVVLAAPAPITLSGTEFLKSVIANTNTAYVTSPEFNLFRETILTHFVNVKLCWKPARGIPSAKWIAKEIDATWEAANRFYYGEPDAPYILFTVGLSESGGFPRGNAPLGEDSHGWTCATVEEARRAGRAYSDIPCPRLGSDVAEKLDSDPKYCMMVTAAVLRFHMYEYKGDFIRALMVYKYGARGLDRALGTLPPGTPITTLRVWKHYIALLEWIYCIRSRVVLHMTIDCGCARNW